MTIFYAVNVVKIIIYSKMCLAKIIINVKDIKSIFVYIFNYLASILKFDLVMFHQFSLAFVLNFFFIIYFCFKINLCMLCFI